ncbi:uncharacterized protein UTRI_04537_B [Ustilago trichophora]|uniref:Effector family protein Eff1 n=1 Tax=Ustilago trichophora TaxID=86804 RepID=A0A5C3EEP9_9BASI|nr:uncharacterized protein UTRI_04537_B [Ustilago trichophora]
MELIRPLRFTCIAALGTLLLLSCCCTAAGTEIEEAGPSDQVSHPSWMPQARVVDDFTELAEPPEVFYPSQYMKRQKLRAEEIKGLQKSTDEEILQRYGRIPFHENVPIYGLAAPGNIVKQAIKDYGAVNIVDPNQNDGRMIILGKTAPQDPEGTEQLGQKSISELEKTIKLYKLNPDFHILRKKLVQSQAIRLPEKSIHDVPHLGATPIISDGDLGKMLRASTVGTKTFYYKESDARPILVDIRQELMHRTVNDREKGAIERVVKQHEGAQEKFGDELASVLYGQPTYLNVENGRTRKQGVKLKDYPRFDKNTKREEMVQALQEHGRFRFYVKDPQGNEVGYRIKVLNRKAPSGEPMKITVKPLNSFKKASETVYSWLGKIPHRNLV